MKYGEIELDGLYSQLEELDDKPGIIALFCMDPDTGKLELLQVRITTLVQTDVAKLLQDDWREVCNGKLRIAVRYDADQEKLERLKQEILWADTDNTSQPA